MDAVGDTLEKYKLRTSVEGVVLFCEKAGINAGRHVYALWGREELAFLEFPCWSCAQCPVASAPLAAQAGVCAVGVLEAGLL